MDLALVKADSMEDWYTIERSDHDGREWFEQTGTNCFSLRASCRISDACIEGTSLEMLSIANAINEQKSVSFRRCAVSFEGGKVCFWSPRNSSYPGVVSVAEAEELADKIISTIKKTHNQTHTGK